MSSKAETPSDAAPSGAGPVIHIVDDDASFLRSVSRLLRASGYPVRTFGSARQFLDELGLNQRGCVVMDLQMPGFDGLELQQALRRSPNPLPVIFLTGQGDIPSTVRAMRLGAEDFLTKRAPKEQLLNAVKRALARDEKQSARRERQQELRSRFAALSERELEVLSHVLRGEMNKEIAAELGLNERTVKLHRTSITRKLGVFSVAELARLSVEAGIFSGEPGNSASE
jgi:FixJ family two-component response regulator